MSAVVFKIYSGLHLGAQIVLEPGAWVFGRDDSADIIFWDESVAARHVAVTVHDDGRVELKALDAPVSAVSGENLPDGFVSAGELWRFGDVLAAWGPQTADAAFWSNVSQAVRSFALPAPAQKETLREQESSGSEASGLVEAATDGRDQATSEPRGICRHFVVGSAAALTALCMLVVFMGWAALFAGETQRTALLDWLERHTPAAIENCSRSILESPMLQEARYRLAVAGLLGELPGAPAQSVQNELAQNGLPDLVVRRVENGAYHVAGIVPDDAHRARLLEVVGALEWPVVLDVVVESDYVEACRSAFNTQGFWPQVQLHKTDNAVQLQVSGYMLSSVIEEKVFASVQSALPESVAVGEATNTPLTVTRRIRYADDVKKWLDKAFEQAAVTAVRVSYLPGTVQLQTTLTPQQSERVRKALTLLQAMSDVPVKVDVVNVKPSPQTLAAERSAKSDAPSFKVVAVSGAALKFVTLSDGKKVFQGGTLPGGYRLEAVHADRLVLSKGARRINYPLKVKK